MSYEISFGVLAHVSVAVVVSEGAVLGFTFELSEYSKDGHCSKQPKHVVVQVSLGFDMGRLLNSLLLSEKVLGFETS